MEVFRDERRFRVLRSGIVERERRGGMYLAIDERELFAIEAVGDREQNVVMVRTGALRGIEMSKGTPLMRSKSIHE